MKIQNEIWGFGVLGFEVVGLSERSGDPAGLRDGA